MFWFGLRKDMKKAFKKISSEIANLTSQSLNNRVIIESNKEKIKEFVSKKEVDIMIRESLLNVQSEQNYELKSEPRAIKTKEKNYENIVIKKAIKTRPDVIKQAIQGLIERDMNTTNIFRIVVEEKKLCGKTQFFHYLSIVRTGLRTELRPELRTKH